MNLKYIYSKIFKKLRGSSILNSVVDKTSKVESGSSFINSNMDKYSFCGYDCEIINTNIGKFTSIANNVIIGGAMHPMDWVSMSPVFYHGRDSIAKKFTEFKRPIDKKTIIGNDVWIGQYAMIKQGVTIGDGAVIGMGSVVTKDVGSYEVWAGNPAKFLKKRFDDDTIEILNNSKWWLMSDDKLQSYANDFNNIEAFKKKIRE